MMHANSSQKALPGQLDLTCRLASFESALRHADSTPLSQFDFFFNIGVWAWTVVGNGDACEGSGTQIVAALSCDQKYPGSVNN